MLTSAFTQTAGSRVVTRASGSLVCHKYNSNQDGAFRKKQKYTKIRYNKNYVESKLTIFDSKRFQIVLVKKIRIRVTGHGHKKMCSNEGNITLYFENAYKTNDVCNIKPGDF